MIIFENDNKTERVNFNYKRPDLLLLANMRNLNNKIRKALYNEIDPESGKDKFIGSVLGLAIGDILGCPVEGMSYKDIKLRYKRVDTLIYPNYWKHWRLSGLHSDDTQQMLAILKVLKLSEINSDKDIDTLCQELASLYIDGMSINQNTDFGCWRGTGKGFRSVIEKLNKDKRDLSKSIFSHGAVSAGLGGAMRIPPLGVLVTDKTLLEKLVSKVTLVTHSDSLGLSSSFIAAISCSLLRDKTISTFDQIDFLNSLYLDTFSFEKRIQSILLDVSSKVTINPHHHACSKLLKKLPYYLNLSVEDFFSQLNQDVIGIFNKQIPVLRGFAPSGIIVSLYFFLKNVDDPIIGLLDTINSGGDTDTIGAITGSFYGSLHGIKAYDKFIPDIYGLQTILEITNDCYHNIVNQNHDFLREENLYSVTEYNLKIALQNA